MDESIDSIKTAIAAFLAWLAGAFMDNPIGTATALVGLLYVFEKWRTQRSLRKKTDIELEDEIEKHKKDGENT